MCDDRFYFTLENGVCFYPHLRSIITRTGDMIELSENSYRFLMLLLEGEFDKQKIISEVWREQRGLVSDSSYYGQIYILRKALETAGLSGTLIKTIPRRGVRYLGNVVKCIYEGEESNENPDVENAISNVGDVDNMIEPMSSGENSQTHTEWYKTRQWGIFVSVLAILAVCWLTTLAFFILIFLDQTK